jgi:hypothetical protein
VDATTTAQVTMNNNVFGGTSGGYRVKVTGKTANSVIFSGNRAFNQSTGTEEFLAQGSGSITVTGGTLNATQISINGSGATQITNCNVVGGTLSKGSGVSTPLTVAASALLGTAFTPTGTGSGGATVSGCYLNASTVNVVSGSSGALTLSQVDTNGSTFTVSSSGALTPVVSRGRVLGATLDTGGFSIDIFDVVGGTATLTANQSDRVRNASTNNLI